MPGQSFDAAANLTFWCIKSVFDVCSADAVNDKLLTQTGLLTPSNMSSTYQSHDSVQVT